jgi:hypothetical protein
MCVEHSGQSTMACLFFGLSDMDETYHKVKFWCLVMTYLYSGVTRYVCDPILTLFDMPQTCLKHASRWSLDFWLRLGVIYLYSVFTRICEWSFFASFPGGKRWHKAIFCCWPSIWVIKSSMDSHTCPLGPIEVWNCLVLIWQHHKNSAKGTCFHIFRWHGLGRV